jgi:hypothetical protein
MSDENTEVRRVFLNDAEVEWIRNAVAGSVQTADPAAGRLREKLRDQEPRLTGDILAARVKVRSIEMAFENCTTQSGPWTECWKALHDAAVDLVTFAAPHM